MNRGEKILQMGRRIRIGLQMSSVDSGYKMEVYNAITEYCAKKKYDLVVFPGGSKNSNVHAYQQTSIYSHITKKNVDALIITSSQLLNPGSGLVQQKTKKESVPIVCISEENSDVCCITADYKKSYRELITHMVKEHKCKVFNIVTGPYNNNASVERLKLCVATLKKFNITVPKKRIYNGTFEDESGYFAMTYFSEKKLLPADCVISLNDNMCLGILQYATDHNIDIPKELKLIGFDDIPRASHTGVTISTLCQNLWPMCKQAVEYAGLLAQGKKVPKKTLVDCLLKYRQSCGCIPLSDYTTDYISDGKKQAFQKETYRNLGIEYYALEHDVFLMRYLLSNLNAVQTVDRVIYHLKAALPFLRIKACAVVLFERKLVFEEKDTFTFPSRATLVMSYEENNSATIEEIREEERIDETVCAYKSFVPSEGILPEGTFFDRQRLLIIKALYYKNLQFGYVVYEPGEMHPCLYDTLFTQLSTTMNAAILFTEKSAAEKKLSVLLKNLETTNTELTGMSLTDEMTGLYNRRALLSIGQHSIDLALEMKRTGIVAYADMDGLKAINDTFGHDAGDIAIKSMAKILKQVFRGQDVVARLGGDEFVIIATGITTAFMPKIRERLTTAESSWNKETKYPFKLSISMGAVDFDENNHMLEEMLTQADKVMYEEKKMKKSRSTRKEKIK